MRTKKIIAFLGSMVMLAGVSACGTNDPTASTTSDGKTIIKIQTFNNYGTVNPRQSAPAQICGPNTKSRIRT